MEDEPLNEPKRSARQHRFSVWDGTQDPLGPDVEEIFNRLSEDVFHGWDFETALRRMLSQGWRDKSGRRLMGLEEMTERLARQRRKQLHNALGRELPVPRATLAAAFADCDIDSERRAQTLSLAEWECLHRHLAPLLGEASDD